MFIFGIGVSIFVDLAGFHCSIETKIASCDELLVTCGVGVSPTWAPTESFTSSLASVLFFFTCTKFKKLPQWPFIFISSLPCCSSRPHRLWALPLTEELQPPDRRA